MQGNRPTYKIMLENETDAVAVLYNRYGRKLFGYGMYTWKLDDDTNWDMVYKTLFKVCEKIKSYDFDSEKGFSAVVYKIYINYLRKHYRKEQQLGEYISFENFNESLFEDVENRSLKTEREIKQKLRDRDIKANQVVEMPKNEKLLILEEELEKLKDWERMLLLLKGQNMPYKEIAKYVDKPPHQLKVYYQRLKTRVYNRVNDRLNELKKN